MKSIIACTLVFGLSTLALGLSPALALPFKQIEQSKNVSQLLRSNADHFWDYSKDSRKLKDLANYLDAEGTISGDLHLGNMTVIPVQSQNSEEQLRFLNVDFDDGGHGPFALEFARFVTVARASSDEIKIKLLMNAYRVGLSGDELQMPESIQRAEAMTMAQYESLRAAYVAKKIAQKKFKYSEGEIEKWNGSPNLDDMEALFKNVEVLDVAKRPQERGGSLSEIPRLWVLLKDKAGENHILELKPYMETSLAMYTPQDQPEARVKTLHSVYWPGLDSRAYNLVTIKGVRYWLREKKVEIVKYQTSAEEDAVRVYIANLIGLTQRQQPEGAKLMKKIEENPDRFLEAVRLFSQEYIDLANEALNKP